MYDSVRYQALYSSHVHMSQTGHVTYLLVLLSNRHMYEQSIQHSRQYGLIQNRLLAHHTCLLLSNSQQKVMHAYCDIHLVWLDTVTSVH